MIWTMRLHHQLERPTQSKLWIPRWTRDLSENVHLQSYLIINKAINKIKKKVSRWKETHQQQFHYQVHHAIIRYTGFPFNTFLLLHIKGHSQTLSYTKCAVQNAFTTLFKLGVFLVSNYKISKEIFPVHSE